jgi:predicted CXXCH cytochrome family protein
MGNWPEPQGESSSRFQEGPGASNHPVNVRPSTAISIPTGWPLAANGTITCITCHEGFPTAERFGAGTLRGDANSAAFCVSCHTERGPKTGAGMHWRAVSQAHPGSETAESRGLAGAAISHSCLECHDGVSASDAGHETTDGRSGGFVGDRSRNHPVGVHYPPSGTRGVEVPLRPASLLPKSIRLPDGKVSCVSCHDVYGRGEHKLTVPIEGSRLCMTCHVMD